MSDVIKRENDEKVKLHLSLEPDSIKDLGEGIVEAIVTTKSLDRHGEYIDTEGIDTKNYEENNPIVLYGHDYYNFPIGKTLKLTKMKNKMKARFQLAIAEYDFAATAYKLILGGYLNTVSIGGLVKKWTDDYKGILELEMLEFSVVPIPANPEAVITARSFEKMAGKPMEEVEKEYKAFMADNLVDKLKGMGDDELTSAIKGLKTLLARLEESAEAKPSTSAPSKIIRRIVLRDAKNVNTQSQKIIKIIKLKT